MLQFILHSVPKTKSSTQLLLQIELRIDRGNSTIHISGKKEEMYSQLKKYLPPSALKNGEKALLLLLQEEISFRRHEASISARGVTSLSRQKEELDPVVYFRIRPSSIYSTLEILSAIGQLVMNGQKIIFDRLSNPIGLEITMNAERQDEREELISLELALYSAKSRQRTIIPSGNIALIMSSPTLIAHGSLIQRIHDSISWKTITPFIHRSTKATLVKESSEFKDWKKYAEEDACEDETEFKLVDNIASQTCSTSDVLLSAHKGPLPILKLHHSHGLSASLLMEYELAHEKAPRILEYLPHHQLTTKITPSQRAKETWRDIREEESWEKDLIDCGFSRHIESNGEIRFFCSSEKSLDALKTLLEIGWKVIDHMARPIHLLTHIEFDISDSHQSTLCVEASLEMVNNGIQHIPFKEFPILVREIQKETARKNETEQASRIISCGSYSLFIPVKSYASIQELASEIEIIGGKTSLPSYKVGLLQKQSEDTYDDLISYRFCCPTNTPISSTLARSFSFHGNLYPYQEDGVQWLLERARAQQSALVADEMGLGKTVQVLAWLSRMNFLKPVMIIVPKALLFNWEREIKRFLPELDIEKDILAFHGNERQQLKDVQQLSTKKIILSSYNIVRIEKELLSQIEFGALIIDEAQYIKNHQSLTYQAIASIPSDLHLILTGTPIENSLSDLWSHFNLIEKRLFKEREQFLLPLTMNISPLQQQRELQKIKKLIHPFTLRRTKKMVAKDLPEIIDQTVWVEMEEEQKARYNSFLASLKEGKVLKLFEESTPSSKKDRKMKILEALLRLRQIACHHELFNWQSEKASLETPSTAKWELVINDIAAITSEGKKVIVFSQFASIVDLFQRECISRGILQVENIAAYHGQNKTTTLEKAVDRFQNTTTTCCLFITLKAGGVGINLTQADTVILYDPWWNKAAEEQAIARAHRIGRKEPITVKRYITQGTIEERVWGVAQAKESLFHSLFTPSEESSDHIDTWNTAYDEVLENLLFEEFATSDSSD